MNSSSERAVSAVPRLAYVAAGDPSQPLVVLVHGVTNGAAQWVDCVAGLKDRFFVVALDLLGHGLSPRIDPARSPFPQLHASFAATLEGLVRLHGPAIVIAHSMGGALASLVENEHPEWFQGLVLEDPAWLSDEQKAEYLAAAADNVKALEQCTAQPLETLRQFASDYPWLSPSECAGWYLNKPFVDPELIRTGIVTFDQPWQGVAQALSVPTLVISSDTDQVLVSPEDQAEIASWGKENLRVEIIPGVSHTLRRDNPEAFHDLMETFIAGL